MADVQFYQLTLSPLPRVLPKLLEKAYGAGKRTLVLARHEAQTEELCKALWTYHPQAFLPHGTKADPNPERQPIYLTHVPENPNNATVLVVTDGSAVEPEETCEKLLDLFDGTNEESVRNAHTRMQGYKNAGHSVTHYTQTEAGWSKAA